MKDPVACAMWWFLIAILLAAVDATPATACTNENQVRPLFAGSGISFNGNTSYYLDGVLEICRSGSYSGICASTFAANDVTVFCRMIGYEGKMRTDKSTVDKLAVLSS